MVSFPSNLEGLSFASCSAWPQVPRDRQRIQDSSWRRIRRHCMVTGVPPSKPHQGCGHGDAVIAVRLDDDVCFARLLARMNRHGVGGFIAFDRNAEFGPFAFQHLGSVRFLVNEPVDTFEPARFLSKRSESAQDRE